MRRPTPSDNPSFRRAHTVRGFGGLALRLGILYWGLAGWSKGALCGPCDVANASPHGPAPNPIRRLPSADQFRRGRCGVPALTHTAPQV